jgi:hypothetical protein
VTILLVIGLLVVGIWLEHLIAGGGFRH